MNGKDALRKAFLKSRQRSNSKSIHTEIQRKLVEFLLPKKFQHIALYHPVRAEVDVFQIIEMLPEKFFYLPRVIGKKLVFAQIYHGEVLVEGPYGILEPAGKAADDEILDVIVVPGLAFTKEGGRLGYGGGFYDRFLENQKSVCIGVCQDLFLKDELPVEAHDKRMDFVITEKEKHQSLPDKNK